MKKIQDKADRVVDRAMDVIRLFGWAVDVADLGACVDKNKVWMAVLAKLNIEALVSHLAVANRGWSRSVVAHQEVMKKIQDRYLLLRSRDPDVPALVVPMRQNARKTVKQPLISYEIW